MRKTPAYNSKLEIFRFLTYTFVAIVGLFVVSEMVLLLFWRFNFEAEQTPAYQNTVNSISERQASTVKQYQSHIQGLIIHYRQLEDKQITDYQGIKQELLATNVPREYKDYHLQLVLLFDKHINNFAAWLEDNSRESELLYNQSQLELDDFINNTSWLKDDNILEE